MTFVVPEPDASTANAAPSHVPNPWDDIQQEIARQVIGQRAEYGRVALGILQAWVGFIIVLALSQMTLRTFDTGLHDGEFIAAITSTTASVVAFAYIVARFLFPDGGSQDATRPRQ